MTVASTKYATPYLKERWSGKMDQGFRRGMTAGEKTELWDRWQHGESQKRSLRRHIDRRARWLGYCAACPRRVSREISSNGSHDGYRAAFADDRARAPARRPKRLKLATNAWLRPAVASKLRFNWAPHLYFRTTQNVPGLDICDSAIGSL